MQKHANEHRSPPTTRTDETHDPSTLAYPRNSPTAQCKTVYTSESSRQLGFLSRASQRSAVRAAGVQGRQSPAQFRQEDVQDESEDCRPEDSDGSGTQVDIRYIPRE